MIFNPQLELAWKFVELTDKNIFLTGKAGTGKTTFLHELKKKSPKRSVVVAPTGVAAINAGGVTIHSFFQMPFGPFLPREFSREGETPYAAGYTRVSRQKIDIIRSLDLLIIDEISMVRADLLDGIDEVLRRYRRTTKPFGGVQLLMIGDIRQLSPIAKEDEWNLLRTYYSSLYFFASRALNKTDYISIELEHIYRQSDRHFIDILNKIRDNRADQPTFEKLNERYIPDFSGRIEEGYILLTTHNAKAAQINQERLSRLQSNSFVFQAECYDEFPEYLFPTNESLELKTGAQVMFVKNDPSAEKKFYNGKIGIIKEIDPESKLVYVKCPEDNEYIEAGPAQWENCRYSLNPDTKEIEEKVVGRFVQFPLKLAWAITIHKSQGLTFEKAIIDAQDSFAHGQVYVALSRCRSLEGIVLSSFINPASIKTDTGVHQFSRQIEENQPDEPLLKKAQEEFEHKLILDLFDFRAIHQDLSACLKTARENKSSIISEMDQLLGSALERYRGEVVQVADKFLNQLSQLPEGMESPFRNATLQERMQKASVYFLNKLDDIMKTNLAGVSLETDNQLVNKLLKQVFGNLYLDLQVKSACLEVCRDGLTVKALLEARAKASVATPSLKKPSPGGTASEKDKKYDMVLYSLLRQWRNRLADEQDVPAYRVLPQKALMGIAASMPSSPEKMLEIKGIGKKKISTYGKDILEIIAGYCTKNGIAYQPDYSMDLTKKKKAAKPDTKKITLELYRQGKSINEIAAERGLAATTIEGHLAYFVGQSELGIDNFLTEIQLKEILDAARGEDPVRLTALKEKLKDKYSYSELKMAMAFKQFVTKKK
jgi:hypothetical protein